MAGTETPGGTVATGTVCELPNAGPSHSITARTNGLLAAFTVENVPTAKPVQIGSEFSYSPRLVIINLELRDQMQEPEMDRVTVLDLIDHDGRTIVRRRQ